MAEPRRTSSKGFSRLSVVSRSKQVQDQLSAAIRRGDYEAGARLPSERELTESFGVSRVSVREAIKALEALGLVEVRHGNGCFVLDQSQRESNDLSRWLSIYRNDLLDLIGVREVLDRYAAELAAQRHDPEAVEAVGKAERAFAEAAENPDSTVDDLIRLDSEFHREIGSASRNPLLRSLLDGLHDHLAESRRLWLANRSWARSSAGEHAAIAAAIADGDDEAARDAVTRHMTAVRSVLTASGEPTRA